MTNFTRHDSFGFSKYEVELEEGVLDNEAVDTFTHGQCHSLALALAKLTGRAIFVLSDDLGIAGHVAVADDDGHGWWDVRGHHEPGEDGLQVNSVLHDPEELRDLLEWEDGWHPMNVEGAMPFARRVAEKFGLEVVE